MTDILYSVTDRYCVGLPLHGLQHYSCVYEANFWNNLNASRSLYYHRHCSLAKENLKYLIIQH